MYIFDDSHRSRMRILVLGLVMTTLGCSASLLAQQNTTSKTAPTKKVTTGTGRPLSKADVEKLWGKDENLLLNQIRLHNLDFEPEEDWVMNQLPKNTGVPLSALPRVAAELRSRIPPAPTVDQVTAEAPAILDHIKIAAQQRDVKQLEGLLHPELLNDKANVYDLFDNSNYKGHTLGAFASEPNREVSVQFFELTASGVEKVNYVYFITSRGHLAMRDVKSGPEEAERFMRDEEKLAHSKLQLMFRALNDGDDAGVKQLCTQGMYEAIKEWGGAKHPGDRLTRGRRIEQVQVKTSVPLDQKSVRVVALITYPLTPANNVEFYIDFERVGKDLKIVRARDLDNKYIVFDPNEDNYLNERYGLPPGPIHTVENVAMTERLVFLSMPKLKALAPRVLADGKPEKIKELALIFIESDPNDGSGYGMRAAAEQIFGSYDDAERDATRALELNGTAYLGVERHIAFSNQMFTPVILGISKTKIDYLPAPGRGNPETIDIRSAKIKFDGGIRMLNNSRPFLALSFQGNDGRSKTYNFAALGTSCAQGKNSDLVAIPGGNICGVDQNAVSTNNPNTPTWIKKSPFSSNTPLPVYVPQRWRENLTAVLRTIQQASLK